MRKLLVALCVLGFSFAANAASVHATWTLPTTNTDGSTLVPADLASTTVQYGTCNGAAFGTSLGAVNVLSPLAAADTPTLAPGVYCFRAFVTGVAAKGGNVSAFSNVATATVPFPTPGAPTAVTVTLVLP